MFKPQMLIQNHLTELNTPLKQGRLLKHLPLTPILATFEPKFAWTARKAKLIG